MPLTIDEFTGWRYSAATLKNTRGYDNQDAYGYDGHTFVVADGVSKSTNPAAAANAVVDFAVSVPSPCGTGKDWADQLLTVADRRARAADGLTTMTGLRFLQREPGGSMRTVVFHVGDSMLLRVRGDRVDRLTTPHSVVEGLIKARAITREQAKTHGWRNVITSALGDLKDRQVRLIDVCDRDALVLCTDGVHGRLAGADVLRCLTAEDPAQALCAAGQAAGSSDDATAIVLLGPEFSPRWYLFDAPGVSQPVGA